jgi:hypothetical protein
VAFVAVMLHVTHWFKDGENWLQTEGGKGGGKKKLIGILEYN